MLKEWIVWKQTVRKRIRSGLFIMSTLSCDPSPLAIAFCPIYCLTHPQALCLLLSAFNLYYPHYMTISNNLSTNSMVYNDRSMREPVGYRSEEQTLLLSLNNQMCNLQCLWQQYYWCKITFVSKTHHTVLDEMSLEKQGYCFNTVLIQF